MKLTDAQLRTYHEQGFLVLEDLFSGSDVRLVRAHAQADLDTDSSRRVCEAGTGVARATHGAHQVEPFFGALVRLPRLLGLAEQLLGGDVYVHQFKINAKVAFRGESWEWHQDSFFWAKEDGMPEPLAVNVVIHLDEVTEFNGPLLVIPGSHRLGEIPAADLDAPAAQSDGGDESDWRRTVSATLKYTLDGDKIRELVDRQGITSVKGGPGTVLLFHPALVHGSSGNMSPYDRRLVIVSYNRTSNALHPVRRPRPAFLAERDSTALVAWPAEELPATRVPDMVTTNGEAV